jgi:hypothetical protein
MGDGANQRPFPQATGTWRRHSHKRRGSGALRLRDYENEAQIIFVFMLTCAMLHSQNRWRTGCALPLPMLQKEAGADGTAKNTKEHRMKMVNIGTVTCLQPVDLIK